eukprot:15346980-Ditylum_brightwellii.AAC.1
MPKSDVKSKPKVEVTLGAYCTNPNLRPHKKNICYYTNTIKRDVAQPFSTGMPSDHVCKCINQANPEICSVKFLIKTEKLEVVEAEGSKQPPAEVDTNSAHSADLAD